ncbi:MAG: TonB-dependent receptor [Muribaculaceae bacterium]|nr:TonB-dependent receptor [Muribaculaceae bacterium]
MKQIRNLLTVILMFVAVFTVTAQGPSTVTGKVIDKDGGVVGATVMVKNTKIGTATDIEGEFTLKDVDADKAVLIVSYVGYQTKEVPLKGQTVGIEIFMSEDAAMLDEMVVIGYGVQKRGNLTGAMSSVEAKAIERVPVTNVGEAIVGRMPGVQVTTPDGSPDAEVSVRVRGGGSITQSNEPLVLIDGFEGSLNDVPATEVDNIQVLKDAASTAIYGARGANGVVLVTTKHPNAGKTVVNLNAYVQTKELSRKIDVLDPYNFIRANYESIGPKGASARSGFANHFGQPYEIYIYQGYQGYDWQDIIFGTHPVSWSADASITGGNDNVKYKLSYMHQDQPSVMPDNGLVQNNINGNLNVRLFKFLNAEFRLRYLNKTLSGRGTEGVGLLTSLQEQPTNGLQDFTSVPENNELVDEETLIDFYHYDPLENNRRFYRNRYSWMLNTGAALTWTILKGMTLRNEFTWEKFYQDDRQFNAANSNSASKTYGPNLTEKEDHRTKWQITNTLNYNFDINDDHSFQAMLGQEMKHQGTHNTYVYIGNFPENLSATKAFDNFALGTPLSNTSSTPSSVRISSFFGRVNYSFEDRYLATLTLRADGSSKFSRGNRWGFFPAAAVAWRLSNEKFLQDVNWLSNLKVRLSYGHAGNDRIDSDLYLKLYKLGDTSKSPGWGEQKSYYYDFNLKYPINPKVKWETTITRNIGLDFGFFNDRLNGTFELYWNTTKDLLLATQIPGDTGFTQMLTNIGQTSNKGIELNLNAYIIERKDFTLGLNFNIGFNRGKIDRLAGNEESFYAEASKVDVNSDVYWYKVGQTMGTLMGYINDGFYTVDDFNYDAVARTYTLKPGIVDCSLLAGNLQPGSPKFRKVNEDPDDPNRYLLTADDRTIIGETTPKVSGGFGVNATWKGFDLNAFFNFMLDFDVLNLNKINLAMASGNSNLYRNFSKEFENMYYRFDEMGNDMFQYPEKWGEMSKNATIWNPSNITKSYISTYGVEDGSFLRMQTLTLGYSFPKSVLKALGLTKFRLYATGYNLFTITKYSGYDPEVNIGQGLTPNIDYNLYPRSRTYTFGMQLSF